MVLSLEVEDETAIFQFDETIDLGKNRRFYIEAFVGSHNAMSLFTFGPHASKGHKLYLSMDKADNYNQIDFGNLDVAYGQLANQFRFDQLYFNTDADGRQYHSCSRGAPVPESTERYVKWRLAYSVKHWLLSEAVRGLFLVWSRPPTIWPCRPAPYAVNCPS